VPRSTINVGNERFDIEVSAVGYGLA
jgi:hypothetical protein